jgi:small subunit ribosomal protein S21
MRFKSNQLSGLRVEVVNDQVEKALRKFKKKVTESGLLQELREREFYEKPTTARKKAKSAARRRWLKKLASDALPPKSY